MFSFCSALIIPPFSERKQVLKMSIAKRLRFLGLASHLIILFYMINIIPNFSHP